MVSLPFLVDLVLEGTVGEVELLVATNGFETAVAAVVRVEVAEAATIVAVGEPMPVEVVLAMVVLAPDAVVFALARTDASAAWHPMSNG